jgi:Mrp family chromosome partitioning ATPase
VGFALLLESLDRTIKVPEDVEIHARLPILTLLPKISTEHEESEKYRLMVIEHPKSLFSEGILNLRASFRLTALNQNLSTVIVSSSGPREGKSLIAANLAVAMSQEGIRTLMIDGDLRRPVMHKIFRLERARGLTQSIIDLFQVSPADMDLSQMNFGDLNLLMDLQRRSGLVFLNINHDGTPLQFLYQQGKIVASNLEEWQRRQQQNHSDNKKPWKDIELNFEDSTSPTQLLPMVEPQTVNQFFLEFPQLKEASYFSNSMYEGYCQETQVENLRVMTSGPVPSNPSEIMGSRQMAETVNMMKRKFDLIIFDTAPCWPLSDVSLLSPLSDALIYVVRARKASRDLLLRNLQQLKQLDVKVLGVVFNDVDFQKDRYYYYGYYSHYYHYYYYYYYDHGPEDR